jgi:hypothetical protein
VRYNYNLKTEGNSKMNAQETYDTYEAIDEDDWNAMTEQQRIAATQEVIFQQFQKTSNLTNDGIIEDQNRIAAIYEVSAYIDKKKLTYENFKGLLSTVERPFWKKLMV